MFNATVDSNTTISDTHRITYLQNAVTGKAKELIKGYSCNQFPSFTNAEPSTFSSNALAPRSSNVISSNPQASKTNGPENFNQYRTKRKQCPQYSSSTPPQRYNIVKQLELCVNCLSPHHLQTTCVSNNRCQECNGFHHTSLHEPNNFKKSTSVVNAHPGAPKHVVDFSL